MPEYLKSYTSKQDYEHYTGREQATWRYILGKFQSFFAEHAVPVYNAGLTRTGISTDHIPRVEEMDAKLSEFGWGAISVEGFIPSPVFLDLLSRGVLPIARDMRSVEHIGYTPAPDIVHEAAGHAPIIADKDYRVFLESYAKAAYKAILSEEDIKLYEAIRLLSDIKERPFTQTDEIERAEKKLKDCANAISFTSEAAQVGRMAWWTIEYGLCGSLKNPKIYGAGLLSSLQESRSCLAEAVKKIPLSVDCIHQSYDITEPQPQLYVTPHLSELPEVLHGLEQQLSYKIGGEEALKRLKQSQTLNTIEFETGVQMSAVVDEYIFDSSSGQLHGLLLKGRVQVGAGDSEYAQFEGLQSHDELGILWPFGNNNLGRLTDKGLVLKDSMLLDSGRVVEILFSSGMRLKGRVAKQWRSRSFDESHLLGLELLEFDLSVPDSLVQKVKNKAALRLSGRSIVIGFGGEVRSGFSGPCDRGNFGSYRMGIASTSPGRTIPYTETEKDIFHVYDSVREIRNHLQGPVQRNGLNFAKFDTQLQELKVLQQQKFADEWLLASEIQELESLLTVSNSKKSTHLK